MTLTTVGVLAPHLTPDNYRDLLDAARGTSKRDAEELAARFRPQPSVPDAIRKLPASMSIADETLALLTAALAPASGTGGGSTLERPTLVAAPTVPVSRPACARPAVVAPLAPNRYKVAFTASAALHAKLRQAQALLRHQIPTGDLEQIFDRALTALLRDVARQKTAATERPRDAVRRHGGESGGHEEPISDSRYVPATVRRAVWTRDGGRCAFVAQNGRRCAETGFLEFHHILPYARSGQATEANIELRCRAHNGYEAERALGQRASHGRAARAREAVPWYGIGPRRGDAASDAVEGPSRELGPERVPLKLWQSCADRSWQ